MGRPATAWLLLFFIGILLIVIGFTGKLGMLVAVAFTPGLLTTPGATGLKTGSSGSFQPAFPGQTTFPGGAQAPINVPNLGKR
jgi:hypothetical protein